MQLVLYCFWGDTCCDIDVRYLHSPGRIFYTLENYHILQIRTLSLPIALTKVVNDIPETHADKKSMGRCSEETIGFS